MADNTNLSVEEILAACRRMDGQGGEPAAASEERPAAAAAGSEPPPPAEAAERPAPATAPPGGKKPAQMSVEEMLAAARAEKAAAPAAPAPSPPAGKAAGKKPSQMSVEEMLAAARSEKQAPAAPAKPAAPPAKPAAPQKKPPAAAKPAATAAAGPKDTASILAAARKSAKPGPMTKAEAAQQQLAPPAGKRKLEAPPLPEKPAYARPPAPQPPTQPQDRRGFFAAFAGAFLGSSLAVGFTSLAVTNILWALGLARFMFPNILTEPPTRFKVGFPDEYAPGQVETKYKAQFGVWIVRYEYEGQPQINALKTVCTHLGCTPNWLEGEQKFKCPCHGSGFYKDGVNFEGPAPRPLERYAIRRADDGQLEVDKSRTFQQELGQWNDPASFVTV